MSQAARTALPAPLRTLIAATQTRLNRTLLLDGALIALAATLAVTAPLALLLHALGAPLGVLGFAPLVGLGAAAVELRRRWHDGLDAALALDSTLNAKDRFATAWQFAADPDPAPLRRLQLREAAAYVEDLERPLSRVPRPGLRAGRYGAAAVVALGLAVMGGLLGPELAALLTSSPADEVLTRDEPRSAEAIGDAAEALRARLAEDPDRRLDAEINALEHELAEQRRRAMTDRATALEEAAAALEAVVGRDVEAEAEGDAEGAADEETDGAPEDASVPTRIEEEPPEWASRRVREAWREAQEATEQWRRAAHDPNTHPHELGRLQQQAQRRQQEALALARQEESWRRAAEERGDTDRAQERLARREAADERRTPEQRLQDAADRLDRALSRVHREDGEGLAPPETAGALRQAARRLEGQTPRAAEAMNRGAEARDRGDGEELDVQVEEARRHLRSEAGAEPPEIAAARQRLDELHDEVARRAAERGGPELAQAGQAGRPGSEGRAGARGQGQNGQGQNGRGQQGQNGQGQQGQNGQGRQGRGQGQSGQGQNGQGQNGQGQNGQSQDGQGRGQGQGQNGQGQGQGQNGQGQGQGGQGQGQGQGGQGQGQGGQGQGGQGQAQGQQGGQGNGQGQTGGGIGRGAGGSRGLGHGRGQAAGMSDGTGRGQAAGQPGVLGVGQGGQGEGHVVQRSWGSAAGGDPVAGGATPMPGPGATPTPATDPGLNAPAQPTPVDPQAPRGGLIPGGGLPGGPGGRRAPGTSGGPAGPGNGSLLERDDRGSRVRGGSTVPPSLRAYVRRYLDEVRRRQSDGGSPAGSR